jgi:hypothetical protein
MTTYLQCKKCGFKFAVSTIEYLAGEIDCPNCGVPHADKYSNRENVLGENK